jgi:exosome complex component CSL4
MSAALVAPGDRLCGAGEASAGAGVYAGAGGALFASRAGVCAREGGYLSVARSRGAGAGAGAALPRPGGVVLARVTRLGAGGGAATVEILAVEPGAGGGGAPAPLAAPLRGLLRREAVRGAGGASAAEAAAAAGSGGAAGAAGLAAAVRPGDIIRAEVAALGGSAARGAYLLSTARDDCGVLHARAATGERMLPVSPEEMEVPGTGARERRKVARPRADAPAPAAR